MTSSSSSRTGQTGADGPNFRNREAFPSEFVKLASTDVLHQLWTEAGEAFAAVVTEARDAVVRYKDQTIDSQKVGRDLGVRAILTGRILQQGDTMSLNVQLVDVQGSNVIWGKQYHRKFADILAVQEDLSREISQNLRLLWCCSRR